MDSLNSEYEESASQIVYNFMREWKDIYVRNAALKRENQSDSKIYELHDPKLFKNQVTNAREAWKLLMGFNLNYIGPLLGELNNMEEKHSVTMSVNDILLYAQRLAVFVEPPPEYSDPKGEETDCIPGRKFPCPDSGMMDATVNTVDHQAVLDKVRLSWSFLNGAEDNKSQMSNDGKNDTIPDVADNNKDKSNMSKLNSGSKARILFD